MATSAFSSPSGVTIASILPHFLALQLIEKALHVFSRAAVATTATSRALLHIQQTDHYRYHQRLSLLDRLTEFGCLG